jgi:hypothetical protein
LNYRLPVQKPDRQTHDGDEGSADEVSKEEVSKKYVSETGRGLLERFLVDRRGREILYAHKEGTERSRTTTCHSSMLGDFELICMDATSHLQCDRDYSTANAGVKSKRLNTSRRMC